MLTSERVRALPKAELHMHLEGALEPELMLTLARRNGVELPWKTPEEIRAAYAFTGLQSFLDLYYAGCQVLCTEQDFYDLTLDYLARARADGVVHAEVFLGPQSFTTRGIPIGDVVEGILRAFDDAGSSLGIGGGLIVSAHRHRSEEDALDLFASVRPWSERILGFGMGGPELPHPPEKFERFFATCRGEGFKVSVHAGEEGPAGYVRQAFELLKVDRIDHGNACLDDPELVRELVEHAVPLTVCPLSNVLLRVVPSLDQHPLRTMLDAGLLVTLNSDDPAYFGGGVADNIEQVQRALELSDDVVITLARNSFRAAWVDEPERVRLMGLLDSHLAA